MAHVVVDEAEGEGPVHESQAPLEREREGAVFFCTLNLTKKQTVAHFLIAIVQVLL